MAKKIIDNKRPINTPIRKDEDLIIDKILLNKEKIAWFVLAVFLLIITILRLRILGVPLERDEGEYAYMAQLLLKGHSPYTLAYNMKYPGTALMYGLFITIFGATAKGVHLGLLVTNLSSTILVFLIGRRLLDAKAGLYSAICFGLVTLSSSIMGFAFHATHLVGLFALLGIWFLLKASDSEKKMLYFWSGLFMSLSMLMKQSGAVFIAFGFVFIIYQIFSERKPFLSASYKKALPYISGSLLPIAFMFVGLYLTGAFPKFWFWTFTYLKEYGSRVSLSNGLQNFEMEGFNLVKGKYFILFATLLGMITLFMQSQIDKKSKIFILLLFVFSFLSVIPGLYFRPHYFVTLVPAISIMIGGLVYYLSNIASDKFKLLKYGGLIFIWVSFAIAFLNDKDYFLEMNGYTISRTTYGLNPFPESLPVARYIKTNTNQNDRIFVFGSEPQIYFYADRISSSGYIYMYNLMEPHRYARKMQEEMFKEIQTNPPKFIVYVAVPTTWLRNSNSETYIFDQMETYINDNYMKVGIVDVIAKNKVLYKWDNEVINYQKESDFYIDTYRRK